MKKIFILVLTLAAAHSEAADRLTLERNSKALKEAIEVNYKIGRHNLDMGGVSTVLVYDVKDDTTLKQMLLEVMRNTAATNTDESGVNLFRVCQTEYESKNYNDCAESLVGLAKRKTGIDTLWTSIDNLTLNEENNEDHRKFNRALDTIQDELLAAMGRSSKARSMTRTISLSENIWSVSVETYVIYSPMTQKLIVVQLDMGA